MKMKKGQKQFELILNRPKSELETFFLGLVNAYGIIEAPQLISIFIDSYGLETQEEVDDLVDEFASSPLSSLLQITIDDELYFFSPNLTDLDYIIEMKKEFAEIDNYCAIPINEIIAAGEDPLFCIFGGNTPEGEALKEMLSDLGYSDSEILDEMHTIWLNSQFASDEEAAEDIFACITECQGIIHSFDEYKHCIDTIASYANRLPKWVLKGYDSISMDCLKITIKVDGDDIADGFSSQKQKKTPESGDTRVDLHYDIATLGRASGKDGCSWMIFWKKNDSAETGQSIVS